MLTQVITQETKTPQNESCSKFLAGLNLETWNHSSGSSWFQPVNLGHKNPSLGDNFQPIKQKTSKVASFPPQTAKVEENKILETTTYTSFFLFFAPCILDALCGRHVAIAYASLRCDTWVDGWM